MEIKVGSIIKILCINGAIEGGKLVEHTKDQMVIELFDRSMFIVQDPYKNVVAIKVTPGVTESSKPEREVFLDQEPEPDRYYRKEELRVKNLAELHMLKANEERKRAGDLLRSKKVDNLPEVEFGYPILTKSVLKYPKKKIGRRPGGHSGSPVQ
jgi:hypothetical protein